MSKRYYDKRLQVPQTKKQLEKRGLSGLDLEALGIVELIEDEYGFDIDLYTPVDTGEKDVREDGKAYVVYEKERRLSNPAAGIDIRRILKDKINGRRDDIFVFGIGITFEGENHILQTRGLDDLINWVGLLGDARTLPETTQIGVRTESNETLDMTAGQVVFMLSTGMAYRQAISDASWRFKDDIDDASTDDEAFDIYEAGIDTVWPEVIPIPVS